MSLYIQKSSTRFQTGISLYFKLSLYYIYVCYKMIRSNMIVFISLYETSTCSTIQEIMMRRTLNLWTTTTVFLPTKQLLTDCNKDDERTGLRINSGHSWTNFWLVQASFVWQKKNWTLLTDKTLNSLIDETILHVYLTDISYYVNMPTLISLNEENDPKTFVFSSVFIKHNIIEISTLYRNKPSRIVTTHLRV